MYARLLRATEEGFRKLRQKFEVIPLARSRDQLRTKLKKFRKTTTKNPNHYSSIKKVFSFRKKKLLHFPVYRTTLKKHESCLLGRKTL